MRSPKQQGDQAQAAGPIAAAVAASAEGLPGRDLEGALMDASLFGNLAYHAFCNLGFENLDPPQLGRDDSALVCWAMGQLSSMVDEAKAAFYEANARKRGPT